LAWLAVVFVMIFNDPFDQGPPTAAA